MGRLFLVRHGESGWNRKQLVQGQSPAAPGLTGAGRQHAADVAGRLAGSGATLVLTSDLPRAVETAAPIVSRLGVPVRLEPRLRERNLGAAEGRPSNLMGPAEWGVTGQVVTDADAAPEGGESVRQLYARITGLLAGLIAASPDQRIVLVTHGGPIRVTSGWLSGHGPAGMPWPSVPNGSVLEVPFTASAHRASVSSL